MKEAISFFKKVVLGHFKNVRQTKGYLNEQISLVKMDTFKGQDNEEVASSVVKITVSSSFYLIT